MDKALDRSAPDAPAGGENIVVRRKASDGMDLDNAGNNKRKSRTSISKIDYKDESDSDAAPLVSQDVLVATFSHFYSADRHTG